MIQYVCDRCGRAQSDPIQEYYLPKGKGVIALCEKCIADALEWLKPLPKGERARDEK
jgi:hypothetical protein